MKVQEIEKALSDARTNQATLKTQLAESEEKLSAMKASYESAVRSGENEAELDKLDAEIFKAGRERVRIEIRLNQVGVEIEELFREREHAHAEAEDEKNRADEVAAMEEAAMLEKAIQSFVVLADAHWKRIQRISEHYKSRGIGQNPFKLSNLERRASAVFRNGSVVRVFEQSYEDIFRGNIAAAKKQLSRPTPASEANEAEAVQAAVNN